MGRRGPIAKPADQSGRGRRKVTPPLELVAGGRMPAPDPPDGLTAQTLEDWASYWASDVAAAATPADVPVIRRLFALRSQHERYSDVIEQVGPMVGGSRGQMRINPLAVHALRLGEQILRLEAELGLTPASRARLGLDVARTRMTVEQLNAQARTSRRRRLPADITAKYEPA
jgi:P27 family predicted phage terminase small subunit